MFTGRTHYFLLGEKICYGLPNWSKISNLLFEASFATYQQKSLAINFRCRYLSFQFSTGRGYTFNLYLFIKFGSILLRAYEDRYTKVSSTKQRHYVSLNRDGLS